MAGAAGGPRPGQDRHGPAAAVALCGDCVANIAVLREQPWLAGPVAVLPISIPAVQPAGRGPAGTEGHPVRRVQVRERAWALAGDGAPGADGGLVTIDLYATIVADHRPGGNREPLAIVLRAGNAGSNTAADHIERARLCSDRGGLAK